MTFSMTAVAAVIGLAMSASVTSKTDPNAGKLLCEEGGQSVYKDRKGLAKCNLGADTTFYLGTIQAARCAKGSVAAFLRGGQLASCKLATRSKLQAHTRDGSVATVACEASPVTFNPEGYVSMCELSKMAW